MPVSLVPPSLLHVLVALSAEAVTRSLAHKFGWFCQDRLSGTVTKKRADGHTRMCNSARLHAAVVALSLGRNLTWFTLALRTGTALNTRMLRSVLHAPLAFFHTTPTGRILNVFSKDQGSVDEQLPAVRPLCLCPPVLAVDCRRLRCCKGDVYRELQRGRGKRANSTGTAHVCVRIQPSVPC
jgi:hypothetical protein